VGSTRDLGVHQRSSISRWTLSLRNFSLCCLPCIQGVHKEIYLSSNVSMLVDINYIWCSLCSFLWLMWPSLLCHKSTLLSCVMVGLAITLALALVVRPNLYKSDINLHIAITFFCWFVNVHIFDSMCISPPILSNCLVEN
jgi:hypothetical protein